MAFQRRQCIALAMILMLGVAEGRRVQKRIQSEKATSNGTNVDANAVGTFDPRSEVEATVAKTDAALAQVAKGWQFFGVTFCMTSCPLVWVDVVYNQWKMRSAANALVAKTWGLQVPQVQGLPLYSPTGKKGLATIDKPLAEKYQATMRESVWSFLKAVDNSLVQRTILTLLMAPLGLFRTLTGMKPFGLCFFKTAWKDIKDHHKEVHGQEYEQNAETWWDIMLAGCADTPSDEANFEDESATAGIIDSMIAVLSDGGDSKENDAKWASAPTHKQCVDKKNRQGDWQKRELTIEKGHFTWQSTEACSGWNGWLDLGVVHWGHSKTFGVQFLVDPPTFVDVYGAKCMRMANAHRQFEFCASKTNDTALQFADMTQAKMVMDKHIQLLGNEREILATADKINRLLSQTTFADPATAVEAAKMTEEEAFVGGRDRAGLVGDAALVQGLDDAESPIAAEARKILGQVKEGSSLMASGQEMHIGSALLQEALAAAHRNEHLTNIMRGQASQEVMSRSDSGHVVAGSGGAITITEIVIILIICGGGALCLAIGLQIAASNLETSASLSQNSTQGLQAKLEDFKRNSTKVASPHAFA